MPGQTQKHATFQELHQRLDAAKEQVVVGGIYAHYKHPDKPYRLTQLVIAEKTDQVSVVYQSLKDPQILFVRPLESWLEQPIWNGRKVPRFKLVSESNTP